MLQDRPYMRDSYTRRRTSALTWLLSAVAASFVVQMIFARSLPIGLEWNLGLSPMGIRAGHVWTLVTYGFLHSTDYLLQVFAYLLVIYFAGREVLPILGMPRPSPPAAPSGSRSTGAIPKC
jgi:membrane associated rhomboid family serine protease